MRCADTVCGHGTGVSRAFKECAAAGLQCVRDHRVRVLLHGVETDRASGARARAENGIDQWAAPSADHHHHRHPIGPSAQPPRSVSKGALPRYGQGVAGTYAAVVASGTRRVSARHVA